MKVNIQKSLQSHIDRKHWKKYQFSDFVDNIVEKIVPKKSGLDHYLGLEHLDSGSLKIRRFGETKSLIGDKLKIYKGDLIFAKRNAYLKRVAVVEFDAVASAHSMVLRAKPEVVLPEFLPFFMLSEKFWERAIEISVGSLSPTINWKVLAKQEFLLPPKEEQAKLAKLLWAADNVVEKDKQLLKKLEVGKKVYYQNTIQMKKHISLGVVGNIFYGLGQPPKIDDENGTFMIRATNIKKGKIYTKDLMKIDESSIPKGRDVRLKEGDIIVVRSGAYTGDVGLITKEWEGSIAGYDLVIKIDHTKINSVWLTEFLLEDINQKYFKAESIRSAQPHLNSEQLAKTKIPDLPLIEQTNISNRLEVYYKSIENTKSKLQSSQALLKSLINEVFSS